MIRKGKLYRSIDGNSGKPFTVEVLLPAVEYRQSTRERKGSQPIYVVTQLQQLIGGAYFPDNSELPSEWDRGYFEDNFKEI